MSINQNNLVQTLKHSQFVFMIKVKFKFTLLWLTFVVTKFSGGTNQFIDIIL